MLVSSLNFMTTHASQALSHLPSLALRTDVDLPYRTIQSEIGDLVNLVVRIEWREGRQFLSEVLRIDDYVADSSR
jgi:hypothetical protein